MTKNLVDKLLEASALINNQSTRGFGNYIVVNSTSMKVHTQLTLKSKLRIEKIKRLFGE